MKVKLFLVMVDWCKSFC